MTVGAREMVQEIAKQVHAEFAGAREHAVGAGWTPEAVCAARVAITPDLERIAVAVEPERSGRVTGIIVAGCTVDDHFYVLGDYSTDSTPRQSAWRAIDAYLDHGAHVICGMANVVGDYLGALLDDVFESRVSPGEYAALALKRNREWAFEYKASYLLRGFTYLVAPTGALYRQGKVHHVGAFPELEDQMFNWMPYDGKPTERITALAVAIAELASGSGR